MEVWRGVVGILAVLLVPGGGMVAAGYGLYRLALRVRAWRAARAERGR